MRDWGAGKGCGLMGVTIRELNGSHNENVEVAGKSLLWVNELLRCSNGCLENINQEEKQNWFALLLNGRWCQTQYPKHTPACEGGGEVLRKGL